MSRSPTRDLSPTRELPEHLRHWDGRPSEYHAGRLSYFTPVPKPPEMSATKTGRKQRSPPKHRASPPRSPNRAEDEVNKLLQPSDKPAIVTQTDVTGILAIQSQLLPGSRLLLQLQDEIARLLNQSNRQRSPRTDNDATPAKQKLAPVATPRTAREPQPPPPSEKKAPPAAETTRAAKTARQPPLLKPKPLVPNPDGRFEYYPGIDTNIRYNFGRPKVHKYRVMALPWNTKLLPEEEQARLQQNIAKATQRRQRAELEDKEKEARAPIKSEQRHLFRVILMTANDEAVAIRQKEEKANAKNAKQTPAQKTTTADSAPPPQQQQQQQPQQQQEKPAQQQKETPPPRRDPEPTSSSSSNTTTVDEKKSSAPPPLTTTAAEPAKASNEDHKTATPTPQQQHAAAAAEEPAKTDQPTEAPTQHHDEQASAEPKPQQPAQPKHDETSSESVAPAPATAAPASAPTSSTEAPHPPSEGAADQPAPVASDAPTAPPSQQPKPVEAEPM